MSTKPAWICKVPCRSLTSHSPLFYAHYAVPLRDVTYYQADSYVAGLGCTDQHQFCNPNALDASGNARCTDLTGYAIADAQRIEIALNPYQTGASNVLLNGVVTGANVFLCG